MLGVYGAYVGPMLTHVEHLGAMLGPYSSYVELMSSQERRVPFKPLPGPKGTRRLDHVGTMLGVYGAYVGPMLIHVRLLETMLGSYSSHVEFISSQERRVPFKPLPGPKGTRRFWTMSGPCWAYMEPILGLCWAYVGPMLIHVSLLEAMLGQIRAKLSLCQARNGVFL